MFFRKCKLARLVLHASNILINLDLLQSNIRMVAKHNIGSHRCVLLSPNYSTLNYPVNLVRGALFPLQIKTYRRKQ